MKEDGLRALFPILGKWKTSGTEFDDEGRPQIEIKGSDTYELLPGGNWIAHTVDVHVGEFRQLGHELIGGVHKDGGWAMHSFDSSPEPGLMQLRFERNGLLLLQGDGVRSWFDISTAPAFMTTRWEKLSRGKWIKWMDMRFDAVDS